VTPLEEIGFDRMQTSEEDSGSIQFTIIDTRHPFFATQPHQVMGGNVCSFDMIPRILELERRNRLKLAAGTVKMNEIIKVVVARLMV
jgi:hypothetical protein